MASEIDHLQEVKQFDDTKLGVKGLLDSGVTQVPRMFHHPEAPMFNTEQSVSNDDHDMSILPIVDMSKPHQELVQVIQEASAKSGFFQVLNHGIPVELLDRVIRAIKGFHEMPSEEKMRYYDRNWNKSETGVGFFSNFELFYSKAAGWRDTIQFRFGQPPIKPEGIPPVCREEVLLWEKEVRNLGQRLMGYLSEGLGLNPEQLKGETYIGRASMTANYYPHCPEPAKTVGIQSHTDPGILTILLQDHIGGLQVKYNDKWIDLKPVHGALVVNVGDLLQIISNDAYKSGPHRVIANPRDEARVSVITFLSPGIPDNFYGPLPELVSEEKPALYKQIKFSDFMAGFLNRELDGKPMTSLFRL